MLYESMVKKMNRDPEEKRKIFFIKSIISDELYIVRMILCEAHKKKKQQIGSIR